ncbi:MAG: sorbosone dehydrogenase family protein [Pseudomonadota bacterium]
MRLISLFVLATITACSGNSPTTETAAMPGIGASPELPAPSKSLLPVVNIAPAKGWPQGGKPTTAPGTQVVSFAGGLDHPRWLAVLPNGDVLVAESNAPPKPGESGVKAWIAKKVMQKAGAGVPSANRISLLRDADGDGVAETKTAFLEGLMSPFGMALVGDTLYVANADAVVKFPYVAGETRISAAPVKLVDLPGGPLNHHWTKGLIASADGSKLYVSIGSNSNIGENGLDMEAGRAAIWEIDIASGAHRLFGTGLRNPVGMAWEPSTGKLWTSVNERDELGNDLVPDYMTSVQDGGFYGWPWSYYGQTVDVRVTPPNPAMVAKAIKPDYALGSHTASLGLSNAVGSTLPAPFNNGMFIGQHGSWNRKPRSGYKVIFVPFANGMPAGAPIDVLTGFVNDAGEALGRPVGVAIDTRGALLVADDVGNIVWRVSSTAPAALDAPKVAP